MASSSSKKFCFLFLRMAAAFARGFGLSHGRLPLSIFAFMLVRELLYGLLRLLRSSSGGSGAGA